MSDHEDMKNSNRSLSYYQELLSCLQDGEISARELGALLDAMDKLPELRLAWQSMQLNATLMSDAQGTSSEVNALLGGLGFADKVREKVENEEPILALDGSKATKPSDTSVSDNVVVLGDRIASKDSPVTGSAWSGFAIAASVMFMVTFSWLGSQEGVRDNVYAWFNSESNVVEESQLAAQESADRFKANLHNDSILVSAGKPSLQSKNAKTQTQVYLSERRIEDYMLLHAENASLNTNQGIIPFARVSRVSQENQF